MTSTRIIITKNNMDDVVGDVAQKCLTAMEECGLVSEGYAKLLCPVDTGNLRNSISFKTGADKNKYYSELGTNVDYAAYVEFGTGIHVEGGRKTPWAYKDKNGWHMTTGQKAQPFIRPALADHVSEYENIIKNRLKS